MEHLSPERLSVEELFECHRKLAGSHDLLERLKVLCVAAQLAARLEWCSDAEIADLLSRVQEGLRLFSPDFAACEHAKRRLLKSSSEKREHRHYCDFAGHDWECSGNCECACGVPMEGNDHSACPVELRACPEHSEEQQRSIAEAMSFEPDAAFVQRWHERPSCQCGCAEAEFSNVVGWCLHCDHVYVNYRPEIEDRHFAHHCPGAPKELKESARKRLVKH